VRAKQLKIPLEIEKPLKPGDPYRNGAGQLLPWEEPEYIKAHPPGGIRRFMKMLPGGNEKILSNRRL
jgi:hypothetical protein